MITCKHVSTVDQNQHNHYVLKTKKEEFKSRLLSSAVHITVHTSGVVWAWKTCSQGKDLMETSLL